jgi:hypothetical protein
MNASTYIPSSRTIGDEIADYFDQNKRSLTDAEKRRLAGMIDAQVDHIIAERDRLASACEGVRDAQAAGELSYRTSSGRGYEAMLEIERVVGGVAYVERSRKGTDLLDSPKKEKHMTTYEAEFAIGQPVSIVDLEGQKAVVLSINFATQGATYEVAWFASGDRKTAYLFARELKAREE